jgi:hypothetical protein
MSLEMAHKVILPPKKNYIPQFLKQQDINSYYQTLCRSSINESVQADQSYQISWSLAYGTTATLG